MTYRFILNLPKHSCKLGLPLLLVLVSLFIQIQSAQSAPLIAEPRFIQLSTSQGLSQDTVNDLLIDSDGFLWIATVTGLNRFDGYRVSQFEGKQFQLADMSIETLLEDESGNIWIGSTRSGLFRLDRLNNYVEKVAVFKREDNEQWSDKVLDIRLSTNNQVLVTTPRKVILVDSTTSQTDTLFELPIDQQNAKSAIKVSWLINDTLIVGRNDGVFVLELKSNKLQPLAIPDGVSKFSVETIYVDLENRLWIALQSGLFSIPSQDILTGKLQRHSITASVLDIFEVAAGDLFLATDQGFYSLSVESEQLEHFFRPTDSRSYLTSDEITSLARDRKGNLWLGTLFDGALYWSTQSVKFENIRYVKNRQDETQLSSNSIYSFGQFDKNGLWIGTLNGINYFNLEENEITGSWLNESVVGKDYSVVRQLVPWGKETLFANTRKGILEFNTRTKTATFPEVDSQELKDVFENRVKSFISGPNGNLWLSTDRNFYSYNPETKNLEELSHLVNRLDPKTTYGFIGASQVHPNLIWISGREQVWAYNISSKALQRVHQLKRESMGEPVYAESVLQDKNNTLWIAYPGAGLVGIDATIYTEKYFFTKQNIMPSNVIYGLQQDSSNAIWMSSHAGLLKLDPSGPYVQQYGIAQGLDGKEFNAFAHLILKDKSFAYGSQKGITIFNPLDFEGHDGVLPQVSITSIKLSTKELNMPLTNLSGSSFALDFDDSGLTIEFSTMAFEHQSSTLYKYNLDGTDSFKYPPTTDSQVTFPKLSPGSYVFSAVAFDPISGLESKPASLTIKVQHAPWLSPFANAVYIIVFVTLVLIWWYRRDVQNKSVMQAHSEALESKNRLSLALTASDSNVWEWSSESNQFYSPRLAEDLGYVFPNDEILFEKHVALIHEEDRDLFSLSWQLFIQGKDDRLDVTYRMMRNNGKWIWYRDVGSIVSSENVESVSVAGTYSNVTESVADREKVKLFGEAFRHTRDWVIIFNAKLVPVAVNMAFCEAFDIDEYGDLQSQLTSVFKLDQEYPPRFWKKLKELEFDGHWKGQEELVISSEKTSSVLINITSIASTREQNHIDYYLVIMSDISEQKEAENELRRLANFDSLTGLPNRTLLLDRIKHGIDHAARNKSKLGIFFIDLDRFKQVNDSLGHKAGDELLKVVGQRLTNLLRKDDTVARLGGDEFVVMVEQVKHPDRLSVLARELIDVLEAPIQLGNQTVSVSSSVGIAIYPGDAQDSEDLLRNADLAMYHAKEQGRSNFQYFTQHMNQKAKERLLLENRLKKAHQSKVLINYYQPIVNTKTGLVQGFELLMRWPHADGMIPPDDFIPVAEELGLIENMTWDALERAMPVLSDWQTKDRRVYLSVNLSARHFERQISIEHIVMLLDQYRLPVSCLRFEITESALMRDYEKALEYMNSMREQGFIIALDDFGTGYSSLKYLKEFPIQVLKVDKSFVSEIGKNKSNEALVLTTLRMAESLDMYCVAEGIEEPEQIAFFDKHGCQYLQGYYYSKPVPSEKTQALLDMNWSSSKIAE